MKVRNFRAILMLGLVVTVSLQARAAVSAKQLKLVEESSAVAPVGAAGQIDLDATFDAAGLPKIDASVVADQNDNQPPPSTYPSTYTSSSYPSTYTSSSYPSTYTQTSYPSTYTSNSYPSTYTSNSYPSTYTSSSYPSTYTSSSYPSTYTGGSKVELMDLQAREHALRYSDLPLPILQLESKSREATLNALSAQ